MNRLSVWLKLLRENDTAEQMRDKAKETAENAEDVYKRQLKGRHQTWTIIAIIHTNLIL